MYRTGRWGPCFAASLREGRQRLHPRVLVPLDVAGHSLDVAGHSLLHGQNGGEEGGTVRAVRRKGGGPITSDGLFVGLYIRQHSKSVP